MLRSMFSGVSGLQNHQERLDVIGNNISNVNTTGFKRGRVTFQDIMSQTVSPPTAPDDERGGVNPQQVGLGMTVGGRDEIHTQGSLETTGRDTDLAIEGDGFFVLDGPEGEAFTRAGNFEVDANGRLIDIDSGNFVQGYQAENGEIQDDQEGNIRIPLDPVDSAATNEIEYRGNLDSETEVVLEEGFAEFDIEGELGDVNAANHLGALKNKVDMEELEEDDYEQTFEAEEVALTQVGDPDEDGIEASYALRHNGEIVAVSEEGKDYKILEETASDVDELDEDTTFAYDAENGNVSTINFDYPVISGEVEASLTLEEGNAVEGGEVDLTKADGTDFNDETALSEDTSYAYKKVDEIDIEFADNEDNELEDVTHALVDEEGNFVAVSNDDEGNVTDYYALDEAVQDLEEAAVYGEGTDEGEDDDFVRLDFDNSLEEGWVYLGDIDDENGEATIEAFHYTIEDNEINFDATATVEFEEDATPLLTGNYTVENVETTEINGEEYEMALVNEDDDAVAWTNELGPDDARESDNKETLEGILDGNSIDDLDAINKGDRYEIVSREVNESIGDIDAEDIEYVLENEEGIAGVITEDELAVLNKTASIDEEGEWVQEDLEIAKIDDEEVLFEELGGLSSGYVEFQEDGDDLTATHYNKVADNEWIDDEGNLLMETRQMEETEDMFIETEYVSESIETTTIDVFDQQGQQRTLTISFTKRAQNEWIGEIEELDMNFDLEFDDSGNLISDSEITIPGSALRDNLDDFKYDEGDEMVLDLAAITQAAGATDLFGEVDGHMQGNLESYEIDDAGIVTGTYDNGETEQLAQIQMANFTNPEGLRKEGDNLFSETVNSGSPDKGTSGTGGRGQIAPGTLEMSNVDMSEEFTDMIVTQRGFQANSRTITTSDEVLEEIVNMTL